MQSAITKLIPAQTELPAATALGGVIMAMIATEGLDRDAEDRALRQASLHDRTGER